MAWAQATQDWFKYDGEGPDATGMVINMAEFSAGPTLTMDGVTDDWPTGMDVRDIDIGHSSYPKPEPDDPTDYRGTWMTGYDADREVIYCAIVAYDDISVPDNSGWNTGDNMEFYLDATNMNLGGYNDRETNYPDGWETPLGAAGFMGYYGAQQWSMSWGVPPLKLFCDADGNGLTTLEDLGFNANYTSAEHAGIDDADGATGGGTEAGQTIYEFMVPALDGDALLNIKYDIEPGMWIGIDAVIVDKDEAENPVHFVQFGPWQNKYTMAGSMENGYLGPRGSASGGAAVESDAWGSIKAQF
jgi:hypothetical protein